MRWLPEVRAGDSGWVANTNEVHRAVNELRVTVAVLALLVFALVIIAAVTA